MDAADAQVFHDLQTSISAALENPSENTLPDIQTLTSSKTDLLNTLPVAGHGLEKTTSHILQTIVPALTRAPHSRYYGFVTGGVTPPAYLADNLVTLCDQNVSVHLPGESIATVVEDRSLCMLLQLLDFAPGDWRGRTLTTGATASNILGLACGREWVLAEKLRRWGRELRVGEGLLGACLRAGVGAWQVLTTSPHSSLGKAANVVGVGSSSMIDVSSEGEGGHPLHFDMARLEGLLANPDTATIVVISCGEINTGGFATGSVEEVEQIRKLCNRYGAWLHVDGGEYFAIPFLIHRIGSIPFSVANFPLVHIPTSIPRPVDTGMRMVGDGTCHTRCASLLPARLRSHSIATISFLPWRRYVLRPGPN